MNSSRCRITRVRRTDRLLKAASVAGCFITMHLSIAGEAVHRAPPVVGKTGVSAKDSIPAWPSPVSAPEGAPNVVVILLDDVGFSASSIVGGPVQTPQLSKLGAQGLLYNRFHVSALCSPTRAALLSGRNDHRAGFGQIMEDTSGYPGYNGIWRKDTITIAEVLRRNGYSTAAFGKWHNTPYSEISPLGPFTRWPTGLGFEYFYGFMRGWENQWEPSALYRNTTPVEASETPQQGYHLTKDITNEAISWVRTHQSLAGGKPYFLYFATGATHAPHQVGKEWIDRYRGRFDRGWDELRQEIFARQKKLGVIPNTAELTPRPKEIPGWDSLSKKKKELSAREMEVYAGFLAQTDDEVGRLLNVVQQGKDGDNTLILYLVGDNGAEGHAPENELNDVEAERRLHRLDQLGTKWEPYGKFSVGWAWAMDTPFQWVKFVASHLGGTRDPLVVSWPSRIRARGGLRTQYVHVNDIAATIYEAAGIAFPSIVDGVPQLPLDGISFVYSFDDPQAPSRHRMQIFEQAGNRSIYQDGWVAGARHMLPWRDDRNEDFANDRWELYHLDEDFSEARDLAARYPRKLQELQALFDSEARRNDVYPLLNYGSTIKDAESVARTEYTFYAGTPRIPALAAPDFAGGSFSISAEMSIPASGTQGVILSFGGRGAGFVLYVEEGHLVFENVAQAADYRDILWSLSSLPSGHVSVACEFTRDRSLHGPASTESSSGVVRLYVNGRIEGEKALTAMAPDSYAGTLGIGEAFGSPVSDAFRLPFKFNGALEKVSVRLRSPVD